MAIINDYADIRARMKGDLKAEPKTLVTAEELEEYPFIIRTTPIPHLMCPDCNGTGSDMHHVTGGLCPRCNGKGHF